MDRCSLCIQLCWLKIYFSAFLEAKLTDRKFCGLQLENTLEIGIIVGWIFRIAVSHS